MRTVRMVRVATASGAFHARVITARLGAAGVLSETRGLSEGPYPLRGCVDVLVPEDEADMARQLLREDAEAAADTPEPAAWADEMGGDPDGGAGPGATWRVAVWSLVGVIAMMVALGVLVASVSVLVRLV